MLDLRVGVTAGRGAGQGRRGVLGETNKTNSNRKTRRQGLVCRKMGLGCVVAESRAT